MRQLRPALLLAGLIVPATAWAHFILVEPESWRTQGPLGDPQKLGPCGDDGEGKRTGAITAYKPGDTVTITVDETIYHPGHYRVAMSVNDRSELPPLPEVVPGTTPCGSAPIDPNPKFPVLADGLLVHTKSFGEPQTFQVNLPTDVTCEKCTLQIVEFMSNHALNDPGGCYYHHCADISIKADGSGATPKPGGCSSAPLSAAAVLALAAVRRRRPAGSRLQSIS